jgi:hypothetical protein
VAALTSGRNATACRKLVHAVRGHNLEKFCAGPCSWLSSRLTSTASLSEHPASRARCMRDLAGLPDRPQSIHRHSNRSSRCAGDGEATVFL